MDSRIASIYQQKLANVSASYYKAAERVSQYSFSNALADKSAEVNSTSAGQAPYTESALTAEAAGLSATGSASASSSSNSWNSLLAAMPSMLMSNSWSSTGSSSQSSSTSSMMLTMLMSLMSDSQTSATTVQSTDTSSLVSSSLTGGKAAPAYNELIDTAAKKYNVPSALIKGVIMTESSFRADAVGSSGSEGLMQLMPATARYLGVNNSFDAAQNIDGGTKYLREMLDTFNQDVRLALAAYNCGPNRLQNLGITSSSNADEYSRLSSGVQGYVSTVLGHCSNYI